jgi:predicted PurR-regulated permease PerM
MEEKISHHRLKQIGLLVIILGLGALLFSKLYFLMPALLFAMTCYFLMRTPFAKLVYDKKFKEWQAALILILGSILILAIPIFLLSELLIPKIQALFINQDLIKTQVLSGVDQVQNMLPPSIKIKEIATQGIQKLLSIVPGFFNGALGIFTTITVGYFFLYFMFVNMKSMELHFLKILPMNNANQKQLRKETQNMIISNAIGIPILAIAQGIVAFIGYLIFGVPEPLLWAIVTALFSFVPIVGTVLCWLPLGIYLLSTGHQSHGIGLLIYSAVLLTNIDNVLRFTVLKKIGDVHPIVTVLGVIVGLNLFGFLGLIFGPLLISYFLLLTKIYRIEYDTTEN